MIQRIVDFALRQRGAVIAITILIVLLGINAFRRLPIEAYPDVADTWVQIITQWQGHASEEVERQITVPIERVMNAVPQHTALRSTSIAGLSVVTLIFEDGTDSYFARQRVLERLNQVDLPTDAQPSLGPLASPIAEVLRYHLVNCQQTRAAECRDEDMHVAPRPLTELKDLQTWVIERELLGVPGVADVTSFGGLIKQYQVLVDPYRLAADNVTVGDVEHALQTANANSGGGVVQFGSAALNVRGLGLLAPADIGEVPVATRNGTPILIRQLGSVQVGYQPRLGRVSVEPDTDVVKATILMRKGENAQEVLELVHQRIREINERVLPRGVKLTPHDDRSRLMGLTTHTVMHNMIEGIGLVAFILFLFLGNMRAALIVALTIPLALLSAFIFMDAAKIPANLLSIGAVDFGMIVDGAIIMVENIFKNVSDRQARKEPFDLREVVAKSARDVARPIVFAIGIIITAYIPIFALQRVEGKLFRPMAWTVAAALVGALIASITIIPILSSFLFKKKISEFHNPVLKIGPKLYVPALRKIIKYPQAVLVVAAILVVANVLMARRIGTEFLPHLDEGSIWLRATMPANISLSEAEALVDGVHTPERQTRGMREILRAYPEVKTLTVQIGRPDDGTDPSGFYNAEFLMILNDRETWRPQFHGIKDNLIDDMNHHLEVIPGVSFGFSQPISDNVEEAISGVKGELAIKITGPDLNALDDLADQVARTIQNVDGVVDLGIIRELGQSNVNIQIARDRARRYGLTVSDIEDVVEIGVGGRTVGQVVEGERRHNLVVRYVSSARDNVDAIRNMLIPLSNGNVLPLSAVADITVAGGASRIFREANRRYIAIKFGIRGRGLGSAVADAQQRVAHTVRLPRGYEMSWEGEFESAQRAGKQLSLIIPATLLGILLLLFIMFRRPREPLIILANVIVTASFGGLLALLVTHVNFSVSSGVGFLALFGASVQIGVILIEQINKLRLEGVEIDEAILQAADRLFRPILMTILVATFGLLPAAVSNGIGSDSQKPLAIVVVGGLLWALLLSIFMLPLLYKLFAPTIVNDGSGTPRFSIPTPGESPTDSSENPSG